ncbi:hypothetical protein B0T24DRAFT_671554 [Lasiosphaeria ovina]|uniref:ABM domain-containing protein n=1 Tax=Lasiosphaeria ovina TaxID=92902 RepID=A0AAE0MZF4_9PEZI|nr:hypothetical protein B0T24DRAFT_671554 [Lasiosphaeria ovina]
MPQITELAWFPLKEGARDSDAWATLKKLGPDLRAQPGLEASWHGAPLERPQSSEIVNVWASSDAYTASKSSPLHAAAAKLMVELVDASSDPAAPKPYHNAVVFDAPFAAVAAAPLVQMSSVFLPLDIDAPAFEAAWASVVASLRENGPPDGFVAGVHGWALEAVHGIPKFPAGAKVFVTASGWESLEKNVAAHVGVADKFAEVQRFSDVFEAHHVSFKKAGED